METTTLISTLQSQIRLNSFEIAELESLREGKEIYPKEYRRLVILRKNQSNLKRFVGILVDGMRVPVIE